eukprot:TRINITY_DN41178_c0_g1_i1.p1 TRINITY_DN41178_c0_g1~~TRINITY_DN41178_c0_g1_i1.p1  ORF type:complete len:624 (+),score=123.56 TRINITY_DN41178_c0_g1_i1:57-1928(+)
MWSQRLALPRWVVGKVKGALTQSAARLKNATSRRTLHGSTVAIPLTRAACGATSHGGLLRGACGSTSRGGLLRGVHSRQGSATDWQLLGNRNPSCSSARRCDLGYAGRRLLSSLVEHEEKRYQEQLGEEAVLLDETHKREIQDAVQDLVQVILESGDEMLLDKTTDLVASHFHKMAKLHALPKLKPEQGEAERQKFLDKMKKLLTQRFAESNLLPQLLERLDLCHGNVELLHDRLWLGRCQAADDGLFNLEDDEADVDDAHLAEFFERTEKPPPVGTEARPIQEPWVLDVDVGWMPKSCEKYSGPSIDRSILLSNLPIGTTEDDIRAALAPCGPIRSIEICQEWLDWQDRLNRSTDAEPETKTPEAKPAPPPYTLLYAIAEFESPEARQRATGEMPRIFGILFREVRLTKQKTRTVPKVVGRACYPQDVRVKRTLLLRNLSWTLEPWQVLEACCRLLANAGMRCRLSLSNCGAFGKLGSGKLRQLEVNCFVGSEPEVMQSPDIHSNADRSTAESVALLAPRERGGNGGVAVLRFQSFEAAYMALQALKLFELEGRRIYCGFAPWRPACLPCDSKGRNLCEALLLDFPVPGRSAFYGPDEEQRDPVLKYGYTEETMLSWSRSPE